MEIIPQRSGVGIASQADERSARSDRFRHLLQGPAPLILPSAWDAGTARLVEQAGALAVSVSATGVAWSLGRSGMPSMNDEALLAACERVCASVAVPVTVDLRGAPDAARDLAMLAEALITRGVVGVTLPNAQRTDDDGRLVDAVHAVNDRFNARLHVTAHLNAQEAPRASRSTRVTRWRALIRRALACVDAGADGVLFTGIHWAELVPLVRELPVPIGVDVGDGWAPPVHGLARAGVRCVALGLGPLHAAVGTLRKITDEALERGSYDLMNDALSSVGARRSLA